jgi:hypothetical protein
MDVPIIHRMGNEFDHRNLWLQLVLGLLSAGERLDAVLERHAPERDNTAAAGPDGDDALIAFVLGLIACKARLHDVVAAPAYDRRSLEAASAAPPAAGPVARDLLR